MEKTLRGLNLLLIGITLLAYLSPFVDPATFWPFSFFGMAYPWLLLANLLFALFWLSSKKWYFLFSVGCILVGWNHVQSFVGLNTPLPKSKGEITMMTMNCRRYFDLQGKVKQQFDKMLETYQPDVLVLQETNSRLNPINVKKYLHFYQPKRKRLAIYSKYPIIKKGNMDIGNITNGCIFADIKINKQPIRVYNVHLQSNAVTGDASKLQKEGDLQKKETWQGIRGILGKVKRTAAIRSEQAQEVIHHLQKSQHPVIVCGDFNDTPLSYNYQLFSNILKDGFKERAAGIGTTYNGTIPLLRIDYIWTDSSFQVKSHKIVRENFSDHYPVISRIQL